MKANVKTIRNKSTAQPCIKYEDFAKLMNNVGPFEKKPQMAVAVSGGADSMALCLLANKWAKKQGGKIIALTVDHGLREESKYEAKKVKEWLQKYNITHNILTHSGNKPQANVQGEARKIRYGLLTDWCIKNNVIHLLVAHHLEDQAETFLMRLHRGSGVDGLSAMASVVAKGGIRIVRPLLSVDKEKLINLLKAEKQEWVDDPSNLNEKYTRTNIRKMLTREKTSNLSIQMAETAGIMKKARLALESQTAKKMSMCVSLHEAGFCTINLNHFLKLDEEIAMRILSSCLTTASGNIYTPRFEKLLNLFNSVKNSRINGNTLWGCKIFIKEELLFIIRELSAMEEPIEISGKILWDRRFKVNSKIKGLIIGSLSETGLQTLIKKKPELTKEVNLPRQVLYTFPVIRDRLENIVFVPHIHLGGEKQLENKVFCSFEPAKPLAGLPFGCYS